jgi:hypothetical protein
MKDIQMLPSKLRHKTHLKIASALLVASVLSACSDEGVLAGGGAGDASEDARVQAALTLLQPYVGVYQLQDAWNGEMGDLAYLSIRLTGNDGISETALIDYDDANNCVPGQLSIGEVRKDLFSDRVFMDDIFEFNEAELSLSENNLSIDAIDFSDLDNDGDRTETVTVGATRLGLTEVDLGDPC